MVQSNLSLRVDPTSPEEHLYRQLYEEAIAKGVDRLSKAEWLAVTGRFLANYRPPRQPGVRSKDPCEEAMAEVWRAGGKQEIPRSGWGVIRKAVGEIREVMPDLTPEEIIERAARLARKWPMMTECRPNVLAREWAMLGGGKPTASARQDIYREPEGWHPVALKVFGAETGAAMINAGWREICVSYGRQILEAMK